METTIFDEFNIDENLTLKEKTKELEKLGLSLLQDNIAMQEKFSYSSYREFYEILQMIDIKKLRANIAAEDMTRTIGRYDIIPMQHRVFSGIVRKLQLNVVKLSSMLNETTISAKQIDVLQKLTVTLFSTKETQKSFFETVDEALGIGDGFCVTKLKNEEQRVVIGAVTDVKSNKATYTYDIIKTKYPYMQYISIFDTIYTDNGKIQAYCEHVPYADVKKEFGLTTNATETVKKKGKYIQKNNRNACKDIKVFYNSLMHLTSINDSSLVTKDGNWNYKNVKNELEKWFSIEQDKKCEVWNLFIESNLGTYQLNFANGKLVGYGDSTLPFIGGPMDRTSFVSLPGTKNGQGLYDISVEEQKEADTLISQLKDEHNLASVRQFFDPLMPEGEEENFVMEENKISNRNIQRVSLGDINAVSNNLNLISTIQNQANLKVGLNSVILGQDRGIARVAGEITEKKAATDTRIASFIDNINAMASSIAQKMLCYLFVFCRDEMKDWLGEEDYQIVKDIKLKDLLSGIKLVFDSELVLGSKQANIDNIMALLQYTGGQLIDPATNRPIIFMDDLIKFVVDNKGFNGLVRTGDDYDKKLQEQQKMTESAQNAGQIAPDGQDIPPELLEQVQAQQAPVQTPQSPSIVL